MSDDRINHDGSPTYRHIVSVKGVVIVCGRIPLLMNERDEWELPGGKLEEFEAPESCVTRELHEELGVEVSADELIDAWQYNVRDDIWVLILTYGCTLRVFPRGLILSGEHKKLETFSLGEIETLPMPSGYKRSILRWLQTDGRR